LSRFFAGIASIASKVLNPIRQRPSRPLEKPSL
jgi:hypothetical protein